MDSYNQPGSSSETPKSSDSGNQSGGSSGGRRHLQPSDCVDQRNPRSRYRIVGTSHGRRYTNACFSLLSPGLSSETHLRVSQSLSCLTEVCETPESPRIVTNTLEIPPSTVGVRVAAKSCSNLEKIEQTVLLDNLQKRFSFYLHHRYQLVILPPRKDLLIPSSFKMMLWIQN